MSGLTSSSLDYSLEIQVGLVAACAPTLRPLVGRVLRLSSPEKEVELRNRDDKGQWPPTIGQLRVVRPPNDSTAITKPNSKPTKFSNSDSGFSKSKSGTDSLATSNISQHRVESTDDMLPTDDVEKSAGSEPTLSNDSHSSGTRQIT
jgi:hypothetical protein